MKWIIKITKYTAYVSKCAHAIAEAAKVLGDNWPSDNPFARSANLDTPKKEGVAVGDQAK